MPYRPLGQLFTQDATTTCSRGMPTACSTTWKRPSSTRDPAKRSSFSKSPSSQGLRPASASQDSSKYRSAEAGRPGSAVCFSVAEARDASSLSAYAARRETAIE